MKTLINKNNPQIRITAPEIKEYIGGYEIEQVGELPLFFNTKDWTLVEEEETIVKTIKEFVEKGKRCEQQAVEDNDQENYIFWQGFQNCAENILREVEEHRKDLLKLALTADDIRQIVKINYEIIFKDTSEIKCKDVADETLRRFLDGPRGDAFSNKSKKGEII